MSEKPQHSITIWFFVGVLFAIYGVLISACGVYGLFDPPKVVRADLHVDLWWGLFLLAFGLFFTWRFWPRKEQLTGRADGKSRGD
jgi:hypothetical protein